MPDALSYKATLTDGVFLVIPGLLAPEAMGSIPVEAAPIGRFLSGSDKRIDTSASASAGLESLICRWFNSSVEFGTGAVGAELNSAARLGYQSEIAPVGTPTEVYCADPVYQQMDINHATLADQSLLNLTAEDSTAIIDTLNRQFSSDGLVFSSKHPLRWYCQFDKALAIETVSLSSATGRDVSLCRPGGADSRRWRTLLAEIEMILFSHPVNQQREARGELPINSLWLWGGGRLPDKVDKTGAVFTNNFYTSSYANHQGMQVLDISDFAANDRPVLVVDDRLATAAATADVELRKQVIGELADVVFAALNRSHGVVKTGAPVSLWCGGDSVWHLPQRINVRQWFAQLYRPRSFESFIDSRVDESRADEYRDAEAAGQSGVDSLGPTS